MKIYRDVRLADPFLRPYWRHERVLRMRSERVRTTDDQWIAGYRKFLKLYLAATDIEHKEKLLLENPGVYYAHIIHERMQIEPDVALIVEARLLSGASIQQIAHDCKTIPETIEWYEKIFFNVQNFLEHHDWIVSNVLLPAFDQMPKHDDKEKKKKIKEIVKPHLDMTLKFFAYFGGPIVCDTMISGFKRKSHVRSVEELSDYFNEQFARQLQIRSAQASGRFEITPFNVMELFATHTKIIEIQKSADNQENKRTEIEKNIHAMLTDFNWSVGKSGVSSLQGTKLGEYDTTSLELDPMEIASLPVTSKINDDGILAANVFGR